MEMTDVYQLTKAQTMLQDAVRELVQERIAPIAAEPKI